MTANPLERPAARTTTPDLMVLARWEELVGWLLQHTARWPRSWRFSFATRLQNQALEVADLLVQARYEPSHRETHLRAANLLLERMRLLFRIAHNAHVMSARGYETAARGLDETGRMLHGWREAHAKRGKGRARP